MEYNFKDIYNSFTVSYLSNDDNLSVNDIVNQNELQYYEEIEKNTINNISILIKKFKLRVSVNKTDKLSDEIIISEIYDFNLNNLSHTDLLIKIAFVKDNVMEWIESGNLNDYDFIFSNNKEDIDLLKENNFNVIFVKGQTRYLQFKNILNSLYVRRKEKFYNFIYDKFNYVFPDMNNYFLILHSELFDENYYKNQYQIADNTDPAIHYNLIGFEKNYNPSSKFSTEEYYECNPDVKKKGMNPLIHYELYGRKEKRAICIEDKIKRDYELVLKSPYFDSEWYKDTYDLNNNINAVNHYLNIGYLKGYNPGPDFSTYEYYECNRDIKSTGLNPLIHYELEDRNKNRKIHFSDEDNDMFYSFIVNSPYFDEDWYSDTYGLGDDVDFARHYLEIGYARGFNPGPNFSNYAYHEIHRDVKEYGMNPLLHYERYGRNEDRRLEFSDEDNDMFYSFIVNSPYFDEDWYRDTYGLGVDVDFARHYLEIGYARGFNPGPNFNTYEYYECNPDVDIYRMNPLLHYERYGKKEGRIVH